MHFGRGREDNRDGSMIMHNYLAMHINNKDDIVNRDGSMIMHNYLAMHINNKDDIVNRDGSMIIISYAY